VLKFFVREISTRSILGSRLYSYFSIPLFDLKNVIFVEPCSHADCWALTSRIKLLLIYCCCFRTVVPEKGDRTRQIWLLWNHVILFARDSDDLIDWTVVKSRHTIVALFASGSEIFVHFWWKREGFYSPGSDPPHKIVRYWFYSSTLLSRWFPTDPNGQKEIFCTGLQLRKGKLAGLALP